MVIFLKITFFMFIILTTSFPLHGVDGSVIAFNSTSSEVKPLVTRNLTLTCKLLDTGPPVPAVGKRSVPSHYDVRHDVEGEMEREDNDDVTRPDDLSDLSSQPMRKKSVTQTPDDVKFVTSILLTRDGVDLVSIADHIGVQQRISDVIVTGQLTAGQGERGYLQVTWPHPSQAEAGVYRCDVSTLSALGHNVVFSQTLNIAELEVSLNDVVNELQRLNLDKEKMEKTIADQQKTIADQQKGMADQQKAMTDQQKAMADQQKMMADQQKTTANQAVTISNLNDNMNKSVESLTLKDQTMTSSINQLTLVDTAIKSDILYLNNSLTSLSNIARTEPDVFFSVINKRDKSLTLDQVLIYDTLVTNQGSAYNLQTGVFTSPLDGFYLFQIHAVSDITKTFFLQLQHNGSELIDVNKRGDEEYGTASNSVIVRLRTNDQIRVICSSSHCDLDGSGGWYMNSFSGRLISRV